MSRVLDTLRRGRKAPAGPMGRRPAHAEAVLATLGVSGRTSSRGGRVSRVLVLLATVSTMAAVVVWLARGSSTTAAPPAVPAGPPLAPPVLESWAPPVSFAPLPASPASALDSPVGPQQPTTDSEVAGEAGVRRPEAPAAALPAARRGDIQLPSEAPAARIPETVAADDGHSETMADAGEPPADGSTRAGAAGPVEPHEAPAAASKEDLVEDLASVTRQADPESQTGPPDPGSGESRGAGSPGEPVAPPDVFDSGPEAMVESLPAAAGDANVGLDGSDAIPQPAAGSPGESPSVAPAASRPPVIVRSSRSGRLSEPVPPPPAGSAAGDTVGEDFQRALNLHRSGDFEGARSSYLAVLRRVPEHLEARNNLGLLYQERGLGPEAIAQFEAALLIDPASPKVHNNLGVLLFDAGELEAARTHLEAALSGDAGQVEALVNLSLVLAQLGETADAIELLRRALRLDPDNPAAHYNLALQYDRADQAPEAALHYRRFLQTMGRSHESLAEDVRRRLLEIGG